MYVIWRRFCFVQLCVVVALGSACVISELKVLKVLEELTISRFSGTRLCRTRVCRILILQARVRGASLLRGSPRSWAYEGVRNAHDRHLELLSLWGLF